MTKLIFKSLREEKDYYIKLKVDQEIEQEAAEERAQERERFTDNYDAFNRN